MSGFPETYVAMLKVSIAFFSRERGDGGGAVMSPSHCWGSQRRLHLGSYLELAVLCVLYFCFISIFKKVCIFWKTWSLWENLPCKMTFVSKRNAGSFAMSFNSREKFQKYFRSITYLHGNKVKQAGSSIIALGLTATSWPECCTAWKQAQRMLACFSVVWTIGAVKPEAEQDTQLPCVKSSRRYCNFYAFSWPLRWSQFNSVAIKVWKRKQNETHSLNTGRAQGQVLGSRAASSPLFQWDSESWEHVACCCRQTEKWHTLWWHP
jgi:hypothetical protein